MTTHAVTSARAPRFVTLVSPLLRSLLRAGVPLGPNALVTVTGRSSGIPRTTPLAIIEVDGRRWIWSPWGEVHWVRNLRTAGHATLTVRHRSEEVAATELDPAARTAFVRDVLTPVARSMRGGMTFVRMVDQVDLSDPVAAADGRVVFELRPA